MYSIFSFALRILFVINRRISFVAR